jgi:hypothetical protein
MNDLFEKLRRKGYEVKNFYVQRNKLKQRIEIWVIADPSNPDFGELAVSKADANDLASGIQTLREIYLKRLRER